MMNFLKPAQRIITLLLTLTFCQTGYSFEEQWIDTTLRSRFTDIHSPYATVLSRAYLESDFQYLWLNEDGVPGPAAQKLEQLVGLFSLLSDQHPLVKEYHQFLARSQKPMPLALPRYLLANDLLYSDMLARLYQDINQGVFLEIDQDNDHQPYKFGYDDAVDDIESRQRPDWQRTLTHKLIQAGQQTPESRQNTMLKLVEALYPADRQSSHIVEAITFWQNEARIPWPGLSPLKAGQYLRTEQHYPDYIPTIVQQLKRLTLLPETFTQTDETLYSAPVSSAIQQLQQQHGQEVDGIIGPATLKVLNMTPEDRIRQLVHNFRRLYYLPQQVPADHLMINMADYRLKLIEDHQTTLEMKVIVGDKKNRTPIMTQTLTSVILSPKWNIPKGISQNQILPKAFKDPGYLDRNGIRVIDGWSQPEQRIDTASLNFSHYSPTSFPYRLVQSPGHSNLLGDVKFRLSNNKAIYLHDTRGRHLFNEHYRALSNGCVRLENAIPLASRVLALAQQDWTSEQTRQVLHSGKERYMKTPELPVYLMYWTVWRDEQGQWQWRDDIYRKDFLPGEKRKPQQLAQSDINKPKTAPAAAATDDLSIRTESLSETLRQISVQADDKEG